MGGPASCLIYVLVELILDWKGGNSLLHNSCTVNLFSISQWIWH